MSLTKQDFPRTKQARTRAAPNIEYDSVVVKVSDSAGATLSTTASNTRLGSAVHVARAKTHARASRGPRGVTQVPPKCRHLTYHPNRCTSNAPRTVSEQIWPQEEGQSPLLTKYFGKIRMTCSPRLGAWGKPSTVFTARDES